MSTLKVNDIIEATSGGAKFDVPRAWVNFTGLGTTAIRDDVGVSSLTDNGTGDTTVTLSNTMANTTYCVICQGHQSTSFNLSADGIGSHGHIQTSSTWRQSTRQTHYESGSNRDFHTVYSTAYGELS